LQTGIIILECRESERLEKIEHKTLTYPFLTMFLPSVVSDSMPELESIVTSTLTREVQQPQVLIVVTIAHDGRLSLHHSMLTILYCL
jgi:hypothetical protein